MKKFLVYILVTMFSITSVIAQTYKVSYYKKSNDYRAYVTVTVGNNSFSDVNIDTGSAICTLNKSDYNVLSKSGNLTYVGKATLGTITGERKVINQYRIKRMTIGNITLENIDVVFTGKRVIGQNALCAFNSYMINNNTNTITFER